jgi:mannan endo-1,4-beta-mannosidase
MKFTLHISRKAPIIVLLLLMVTIYGCNSPEERSAYWHVLDGQIYPPASVGNEPRYFIGTNFWYGVILASEGEGGDRKKKTT